MESYDAEKFRNIYEVIIRHMGEKGSVRKFWTLPTDDDHKPKYTKEYLEERNRYGLELAKQIGFIN